MALTAEQQAIVAKIRQLHISHSRLSSCDCRRNMRPDRELWQDVRHHFGNWTSAIDAAGIRQNKKPYKNPARYPTANDVLDALRRRHKAGTKLTARNTLRGLDKDKALYRRAMLFFNSWQAALNAAGINP